MVFIDESGDPGLKIEKGSSRYFVISLVVFEDKDEALACDQRIGLLRKELGWEPNSEFHFKKNSDKVKQVFLQAVAPYNFFYFRRQLAKYLRKRMNERNKKPIKEVKMQRSAGNNLLQLADYIAGTINRSVQDRKKYAKEYRKIVSHREIFVQIWPK